VRRPFPRSVSLSAALTGACEVHRDSYIRQRFLTGGQPQSARKGFFHSNGDDFLEDGQPVAVRYAKGKMNFCDSSDVNTCFGRTKRRMRL
jgi:hypothetical protein